MPNPKVRIAAGAIVVYHDGVEHQAATVRDVDPDAGLIEAVGVPGVLRLQDISAVGVYGDEAHYHLDPNGTGGDRITLEGDDA